jgi:spermidine/putrescine transport system permease protein
MASATTVAAAPPRGRSRLRRLFPYLLLAPGILYLVIFYVLPAIQMFLYSVSEGTLETGFTRTWNLDNYIFALTQFPENFANSILYGGLATLFTFLIGFPVAYYIAFRGGRYKNLLLFMVIAPFFTSFLIRTINWKIFLGDQGPLFGPLKAIGLLPEDFSVLFTPIAQTSGLTYNFLPFMILPLYIALEKIDPRLIEAAGDLYANRAAVFRRITFPLALPGIFAGTILTFIPAMGDYINAQLLGNPSTRMIGNVIQNRFLVQNDYPVASALAFILMAGILVLITIYARALGTEQLTG